MQYFYKKKVRFHRILFQKSKLMNDLSKFIKPFFHGIATRVFMNNNRWKNKKWREKGKCVDVYTENMSFQI